jgi:hypothetical protein
MQNKRCLPLLWFIKWVPYTKLSRVNVVQLDMQNKRCLPLLGFIKWVPYIELSMQGQCDTTGHAEQEMPVTSGVHEMGSLLPN